MANNDNEPGEGDKLNNSNAFRGKKAFIPETWRTEMEKQPNQIIAVLSVLVIVLFIIIISLAISLGTKRPKSPKICETRSCLISSAQFLTYGNITLDPCRDFWSYSCDNWLKSAPSSISETLSPTSVYSYKQIVKNDIYNSVWKELTFFSSTDDSSIKSKLKRLYTDCEGIEKFHIASFMKNVKDLGAWSRNIIGVDSQRKVIFKLRTKYDVHPLFKLIVETDDFHVRKNAIKIIPYGLGLPSPEHYFDPKYEHIVFAYRRYMKEFYKSTRNEYSQEKNFAEQVFGVERRLASYIRKSEDVSNYTYESPQIMKVRDFDTKYRFCELEQLLKAYFKGTKTINPDTSIIIKSPYYFDKLKSYLTIAAESNISDYIIWRFYTKYAKFISLEARQQAEEFEAVLYGYKLRPEDSSPKFCLVETVNAFPYAALGLWLVKNPMDAELKVANEIMKKVQASIINNIDKLSWIRDEETRNLVVTKLRNIAFVINPPPIDLKFIETYYEDVTNNYPYSLDKTIQTIYMQRNEKLSGYLKGIDKFQPDLSIDDLFKIEYKYHGNTVHVGLLSLKNPFFNAENMPEINYASLGFEAASAIMESLSPIGIKYDVNGNIPYEEFSLISPKSQIYYDKYLECIKNKMTSENLDTQLSLVKTMADMEAVNMIFDTYESMEKTGILPGLKLKSEELFFLSIAQSMCEYATDNYIKNIFNTKPILDLKNRVLYVVANNDKFKSFFNCSKEKAICAA